MAFARRIYSLPLSKAKEFSIRFLLIGFLDYSRYINLEIIIVENGLPNLHKNIKPNSYLIR